MCRYKGRRVFGRDMIGDASTAKPLTHGARRAHPHTWGPSLPRWPPLVPAVSAGADATAGATWVEEGRTLLLDGAMLSSVGVQAKSRADDVSAPGVVLTFR